MAKIRFGYSDDFTAKNSKVGINTTEPQANLDVDGVVKGQDLKVTGVSSLTAYEGFLRADNQIAENTTLSFDSGPVSSLSGEIIVGTGKTVTVNEIVKETAGVGNNGNTLWHNLVSGGHSGIIDRSPADKGAFWNGEYFDLDGSNDVITGESCLTLFTDDTDHTIEMWVKFDDVTTRSTIISGYKSGDADRWDLEVNGGKLKGGHHETGYFTSTASVVTGTWYHLVYVNDHASSLWRVFINTATDVTISNGGADLTSDIALSIGDRGESSIGHLNGQISIVRIYSKELSSTEISTNYNLGPFSKDTSVTGNLITHYNASNPLSYPGTVRDVETTDVTKAGGSEIECLKVFNTFTPPSGGTNERTYAPKPGQLYYNYDLKTIEFHDGYGWRQVDNTTTSSRAVFAGGYAPGPTYTKQSSMSSVNIASTGNALDFGSLVASSRTDHGAVSSSTRGIWHQSIGTPSAGESLDYIALASGGQAADFGDMNTDRTRSSALSSSTRGLIVGGYVATPGVRTNAIDYIQISTVGNALDFGDLSGNGILRPAPIASPTRGVFVGGSSPSPTPSPQGDDGIQYVTIASKGNSIDFSGLCLFSGGYSGGGVSNGVRGIYGGGNIDGSPGKTSVIGYLTLASIGQSQYFGDLSIAGSHHCGTSNATRGIFNSSDQVPNTAVYTNAIEYISISTQGNAIDFGDDVINAGRRACTSDSHGGLGGF